MFCVSVLFSHCFDCPLGDWGWKEFIGLVTVKVRGKKIGCVISIGLGPFVWAMICRAFLIVKDERDVPLRKALQQLVHVM